MRLRSTPQYSIPTGSTKAILTGPVQVSGVQPASALLTAIRTPDRNPLAALAALRQRRLSAAMPCIGPSPCGRALTPALNPRYRWRAALPVLDTPPAIWGNRRHHGGGYTRTVRCQLSCDQRRQRRLLSWCGTRKRGATGTRRLAEPWRAPTPPIIHPRAGRRGCRRGFRCQPSWSSAPNGATRAKADRRSPGRTRRHGRPLPGRQQCGHTVMIGDASSNCIRYPASPAQWRPSSYMAWSSTRRR